METLQVVEVGPRDGLQNEAVELSTNDKVTLITRLVDAGLSRTEAVSFAHPKRVPQMADAEDVMAAMPSPSGARLIGLVMNWKGWQRAAATEVTEVNVPVFATETFNERNQGAPIAETVAQMADVVTAAGERGVAVTGTVSAAWGCPFEGEVPIAKVVELTQAVAATGVGELALADTIGVADPWSVERLLGAVISVVGELPLRVHFHDTRNTGLANVYSAVQNGVTIIDAAVGGIGGCPFAPAATGNIATEDLVFMLHRAGFDTGIDLAALLRVSAWLEMKLGHPVASMLLKAGAWPT
ncbi:MAG TPA: hydroxymethylglutaryl-CoA lyase [Acidimicrobiia bacterium]|nr:hydroxymethylglutaryl-CoA lyase [Acidimicrobiia bacterium]